ncbi:hypothetical protein OSTOST_05861, partial [Ostertagia ostertagi]
MENLRRDLRDAEEELARVRQELDEKTHELRELRRALPLPDPERLYKNILDLCHEFYSCTTRTTELDNRINALRRSADSNENRLHEVALLELSVEKLRIEIVFIRSQLRTFFTGPALLCAAKVITMDVWRTWMDRPHRNEAGDPLLVRPEVIELVASDQLHQLDRNRQTLVELRAAIMEADRQDTLDFQNHMRATVARLQSSLDAALFAMEQQREAPTVGGRVQDDKAMDDPHHEEVEEVAVLQERDSPQGSPAPEGIAMHDQEREAIQENADFLEEVELEEEEAIEEDGEPEGDVHERVRQENANMRRQIEEEIQQLQQARSNFRQIINDLRQHPTCPPRRYGYGAIRKDKERRMRCSFCRALGKHYSDSCDQITSVYVRRRMIDDRGKCPECLEYCRGGTSCVKYFERCFHCGDYEHHSALCELPDKSDEIG